MIEKLKSVTLVFLVLLSLLQSYLIAYNFPKLEPVDPEEYVQTDMLGSQEVLEDLLFPDQLVLHRGDGQHSVFYPKTETYERIVGNVRQRTFESFRKTNPSLMNVDWNEVRDKQQGVEIRFRDGLPMSVLQRVMQFKGELPADDDLITRIWIFAVDANEARTILFTDTASTVYEAMKADFTAKDMERFVQEAEPGVPYRYAEDDYYLPTAPIAFNSYTLSVTQYTIDQLKRTFFVDPAVIRNLTERDGTEIYTDGKRGLQLKKEQRWLTYSDPVAPVEDRIDVEDNLISAVRFVNQHGGWNGTYSVQKVPQQRLLPTNQAFIFRQYYESLPIMNKSSDNIGFIKIALQKGIVSSYERSLTIPGERTATRAVQLPGGAELDELLNRYPKKDSVYAVFPAYRTRVMEQSIELVPVWTVELRDGTYEYLE